MTREEVLAALEAWIRQYPDVREVLELAEQCQSAHEAALAVLRKPAHIVTRDGTNG